MVSGAGERRPGCLLNPPATDGGAVRLRYAAGMLLGAHESVAGGAFTAIPRAVEDGCETIQIFARPSAQWRSRPFAAGEVTRFRAERAQLPGPVLSHASYLINLCATDPVILEKSRIALEEELTRAEELGLEYVVLHPGAHLGAGELDGIASAAESLDAVHERTRGMRVRLLIEVTAGQGSCLGCRFEQIEAMLSQARSGGDVGVCFDTCHVHASGYDLSTDEGYDRTFPELDRVLGIDRSRPSISTTRSRPPVAASTATPRSATASSASYRSGAWSTTPASRGSPACSKRHPAPTSNHRSSATWRDCATLIGAPRPSEPPPKQEVPDEGKKKDERQQSLF